MPDLSALVPHQRAFCEYVGTAASSLQRTCNNFFRMAEAISSRGVNPVDAPIKAFVNGRNGVLVFLRPPTKLPASSANRPGSQPDGRNLKIAVSKFSFFHNDSLSICP